VSCQGSSGSVATSPPGPLVQKQITVIQVPTLDKNKDKVNKAVAEVSKDELMTAIVSVCIFCGFVLLTPLSDCGTRISCEIRV